MATEKLSYTQISESSSAMKSSNSVMDDLLKRAQTKMNLINDPKVWQSNNADKLRERLAELSDKFPKFTEAVNVFSLFLDDVVTKSREEDEKNAREQDELIG